MIPLSKTQLDELADFLGHDPSSDGEWSLTPTPGPCIYAVNSKGNIVIRLSCIDTAGRKQAPRCLTIRAYHDGYLFCSLNSKDIRLHRLMAWTWLDDWDESLTVNHKDGNKQNNDYHNLEMMTIQDNCAYYHNSEQVATQRARDYAHHGDTIRGRIHITDGVHSKMIYDSEGIPDGWWRGRPQSMKTKLSKSTIGRVAPNKGKQMITDGTIVKYIDVDDPIPAGWQLGGVNQFSSEGLQHLRDQMVDRIYIHKDKVNRRIHLNQLSEYQAQGWVVGMYAEYLQPGTPQNIAYREHMQKCMQGPNNPMYGKHHSDDTKHMLSVANTGRKHTEEVKQKISKSRKGYHHTEETKQKMRQAMQGRKSSTAGRVWITDGIHNKMIFESDMHLYPEYHRGRTR